MGKETESLFKRSWSHDQDGLPIYGKNLKIFSSGTKRLMTLKLGMPYRVFEYYKVCSNDDPGLTLTNFTARSNLSPYAFVWEQDKTMDFSETIAVYDLKLASDDGSDKKFLLSSKPWGYIHVLNHEKKCIKSDLKDIFC